MRDDGDRVVKWLALASDIEEARELRETLRREKERFVQLATAAPGAVHTFALKADGTPTFRYASPRIVDIYGVDDQTMMRDATIGLKRVDRDDARRLWLGLAESASTMASWREEFRVDHPNKGRIWVESHTAPVREADGTVVWHGILHDITDRKRMEDALRTSRSQLIAALDAGGMGVWTWDVANDRFTWDESGLRVLGIDREDAERATFASLVELMHSSDRERVRADIDALLREGEHASGEYRIAQADGSTRWIEYTARAERDAAGRPVRVIGINVDITHRKRAEESQLRSQKLEALGTLAGGIAHDFNNILVAITGNTKLAKSDLPLGHPAQESLDEIARAGARAVDLVRRILTFSRPYDHKRDVMALVPVVDEALKLVRATLPAMISIRTRYEAVAPPVLIDPTQVHQIIVNLATNAAHAIGGHGGHIDVRIDAVNVGPDFASHASGLREGRYVRLEVADDGCGMDRETLERIFDPFFTTKPQGLGTGLGLSVVHGIVKSYDGVVTVYSELGKGTAFRIYFPAAHGAPEQPLAAPKETTLARNAHVLFVDDEPPLVVLVSRMLERLGYRVTGAFHADKALAQFRQQPQSFDAVVTDLAMAGMSGFDVARDVLSLRPELPVIMMSGFIRPEDQQAAAELGVRAVILKPDTVEELGHVLNRLLRGRTDEAQGPAARVADPLA
jgi:PAS domain S-box-containing protein